MDDRYVLRAHDVPEVERLAFQHEVWKAETDRIVAEAGFADGDRVADLGCGPGYLTLELARAVAPGGRVIAIDSSERFIEHLREAARAEGLSHVEPVCGRLEAAPLEPASLDGVVCRWVLMFLPDPAAVIERAVAALEPGGRFVALEYFQFRTLGLWPPSPLFDRVYGAVHDLIIRSGGDPDVGAALPALLDAAGCDVVSVRPVLPGGLPGSSLWRWLGLTSANFGTLVEAGLLEEADVDAYHRLWAERSDTPHAFFTGPPALGVVARKR